MSAPALRWRGGQGLARIAVAGLLAYAVAFVLDQVVERSVVVPACTAHAAERGLAYRGVAVYGPRDDAPGAHCLLGRVGIDESSVPLHRVMPFLASLVVDFAVDMHFTLPLFLVLIWMLPQLPQLLLARLSPHRSLE
jgi:hypothetical protein